VRFRLCTGPTRLLLWFVIPQIAISGCLYQFLLVFLNRLQGLALLVMRSSGLRARLITIGAVVLRLQGSRSARSESLNHLRCDLCNSTYRRPTWRSGLSSHYRVRHTHAWEGRQVGEGELEKAIGLEKVWDGWGRRSYACGDGERIISLSFYSIKEEVHFASLKFRKSLLFLPQL
jgi:hypothetical protein